MVASQKKINNKLAYKIPPKMCKKVYYASGFPEIKDTLIDEMRESSQMLRTSIIYTINCRVIKNAMEIVTCVEKIIQTKIRNITEKEKKLLQLVEQEKETALQTDTDMGWIKYNAEEINNELYGLKAKERVKRCHSLLEERMTVAEKNIENVSRTLPEFCNCIEQEMLKMGYITSLQLADFKSYYSEHYREKIEKFRRKMEDIQFDSNFYCEIWSLADKAGRSEKLRVGMYDIITKKGLKYLSNLHPAFLAASLTQEFFTASKKKNKPEKMEQIKQSFEEERQKLSEDMAGNVAAVHHEEINTIYSFYDEITSYIREVGEEWQHEYITKQEIAQELSAFIRLSSDKINEWHKNITVSFMFGEETIC